MNTGGFISGYRGSPLGNLDNELWCAKAILARHNVVFQPGLNEDLAATAVWGSQQTTLHPCATVDGVFGPWLRHAFRLLAAMKGLRGTAWDVFDYTDERATERALISQYEMRVQELCDVLSPANHATAVELAKLPLEIRGYGHMKHSSLVEAKRREAELRQALYAAQPVACVA